MQEASTIRATRAHLPIRSIFSGRLWKRGCASSASPTSNRLSSRKRCWAPKSITRRDRLHASGQWRWWERLPFRLVAELSQVTNAERDGLLRRHPFRGYGSNKGFALSTLLIAFLTIL